MSENTKIEWTDATFNPWIGCTKVSPGCDNCYAKADFDDRKHRVVWGPGQARSRTKTWGDPVRWNKELFYECASCGWRGAEKDSKACEHGRDYPHRHCPRCNTTDSLNPARRRVFCASLADVFDNEVDPQWRADLFDLIAATPNLDWLLLTKRIGNAWKMMADACGVSVLSARLPLPNVWLGATIVNRPELLRDGPKLIAVPAAVHFWSFEPALGDLGAVPPGLMPEWVIAGGESGPGARPSHPDWYRGLRDQCAAAGVPFMFKQWGNWRPAYWFDGPDADADAGDAFVDLDRTPHIFLANDGRTWDTNGGRYMYPPLPLGHWCLMVNEGKKAAGRLLDGIEHNGFPA